MDFYTSDGVLYHHGVKGQEWGVKNGPPYPLTKGQQKKKYGQTYDKVKKKLNYNYEGTGENFKQIREKMQDTLSNAYKNNEKLKTATKKVDDLYDKIDDLQEQFENEYWDNPNYSESKLDKITKQSNAAQDELQKAFKEQNAIVDSITNEYVEVFKEAAVKDLGFKDIEKGKQMLEDYSDLGETVDDLINSTIFNYSDRVSLEVYDKNKSK